MFGVKQILGGDWLGLWQAFQAPLIGAAVALVLVLLGRWLRSTSLLVAAGGAGVTTGWLLLTGSVTASLTAGPRDLPNRLALIAFAALVLTVLTAWRAPQRGRFLCLLLLALGAAWWLAGGPRTQADLMQVAFLAAALVIWHALVARHLSRAPPGRLVLAAWTLTFALWVVQAPPLWLLLALVPASVSLVLLIAPVSEFMLLSPAIDLAAVMAASMLATGRLPHGGISALDLAILAPLLAIFLVGRLRFAAILATPLAMAIAVAVAWLARLWLG